MNKSLWRWILMAMLVSSILAAYVIFNIIENKVMDFVDVQVEQVQKGINQRFKTFDAVLKKMKQILIAI